MPEKTKLSQKLLVRIFQVFATTCSNKVLKKVKTSWTKSSMLP